MIRRILAGVRALFDFSGGRRAIAWRLTTLVFVAWVILNLVLGMVWSWMPPTFDPLARATARAAANGHPQLVAGYTTTATLIELTETLLNKPGGYLSNDIFPPTRIVLDSLQTMDDMPNWEFGVLVQVRDMARVMRNDFSRSQSQSAEEPHLAEAEGKFFFNNDSWIFPATENEYQDGIRLVNSYLAALADKQAGRAQFYARADNLASWISNVETRLGSLSQRLSASRGKRQINLDPVDRPGAGTSGGADPAAAGKPSRPSSSDALKQVQTPWMEIDDVFYEARGQSWALLHLLRAIEIDFAAVLEDKNAAISMGQIIRELEPTQDFIFMPVTMNGDGFGVQANYSYVMASYLARTHAALIDLRRLLEDG